MLLIKIKIKVNKLMLERGGVGGLEGRIIILNFIFCCVVCLWGSI